MQQKNAQPDRLDQHLAEQTGYTYCDAEQVWQDAAQVWRNTQQELKNTQQEWQDAEQVWQDAKQVWQDAMNGWWDTELVIPNVQHADQEKYATLQQSSASSLSSTSVKK